MYKNLMMALAVVCMLGADDAKKDQDAMQGDWVVVSGERDGMPLPPEVIKSLKRTVKGDQSTVMQNGKLANQGTFKLDPSKKPKTIDFTFAEPEEAKGKVMMGIYELEGDTFKVCFAPPGAPRPTEFAGKAGTGTTFATWKREKK